MRNFTLCLYVLCLVASLAAIGTVASAHDLAHANKSEKDHLVPHSRTDSAPAALVKTQTSGMFDAWIRELLTFFNNVMQSLRRLLSLEKRASAEPIVPVGSIEQASNAVASPAVRELSWAGKAATAQERQLVAQLQGLLHAHADKQSQWLRQGLQDSEVLRFLRARQGNVPQTLKMLLAHDKWRVSPYGAEAPFVHQAFNNSPLAQEIFWLGPDKQGCPTLVIRTQLHDGAYYNDDPRIYTSRLVGALETGRRLFGVGATQQICVLIDRAGTVFKNGRRKVDKLDMAVIPALVELFRHMHSVLNEQYPDLLLRATIAPASWFFSMCYRITSRVMSAAQREKFTMVKDSELRSKLHALFDPRVLPAHLGGEERGPPGYTSAVHVHLDPEHSFFPIDARKVAKYFKQINGD